MNVIKNKNKCLKDGIFLSLWRPFILGSILIGLKEEVRNRLAEGQIPSGKQRFWVLSENRHYIF